MTVDEKMVYSVKAGMGKFNSKEKQDKVLDAIASAVAAKGKPVGNPAPAELPQTATA